jgi:hypothetical protein
MTMIDDECVPRRRKNDFRNSLNSGFPQTAFRLCCFSFEQGFAAPV